MTHTKTPHKPFTKKFWILLGTSVLSLLLIYGGIVWAVKEWDWYCQGILSTNCSVVGFKGRVDDFGKALDNRTTDKLLPKKSPTSRANDTKSPLWRKRLVIKNVDPNRNYFIPLRTEREIVSAYKATLGYEKDKIVTWDNEQSKMVPWNGGLYGKVTICAKGTEPIKFDSDNAGSEHTYYIIPDLTKPTVGYSRFVEIPACEEGETGGQWCKRQTGTGSETVAGHCSEGEYGYYEDGMCVKKMVVPDPDTGCSEEFRCQRSPNSSKVFEADLKRGNVPCFAFETHTETPGNSQLCGGKNLCDFIGFNRLQGQCADREGAIECERAGCKWMKEEFVPDYEAVCYKSGGLVNDTVCATSKPTTDSDIKALPDCPKYEWRKGKWGHCSIGNNPHRTRTVECVNENGTVFVDDLCSANTKPAEEEICIARTYKCQTYIAGLAVSHENPSGGSTVTEGVWKELGECPNPQDQSFEKWFNNGQTVCTYGYPHTFVSKLMCKYTNPCGHCINVGKSCMPPEPNVNELGVCRNDGVACPCADDESCKGRGNICLPSGNCMYCEK